MMNPRGSYITHIYHIFGPFFALQVTEKLFNMTAPVHVLQKYNPFGEASFCQHWRLDTNIFHSASSVYTPQVSHFARIVGAIVVTD